MRLEEIRIRDPFFYQEEDKIYLFGTTDKNTWSGKGVGFDFYITEDMEEFQGPFPAFRSDTGFWADENFWAPEIWKWNGTYYMIASCKAQGKCRGVQIFYADTPDGPFCPLENFAVTPSNWECLDGTLFMENEKIYLVFSHEWLQTGDGEICAAELSDDLKGLKEPPRILFRASDAAWTVKHEQFGKSGFVTDGPFLVKDGKKLCLIWSSFCKTGYAIGMAVSENGLFGKWEHRKKPIYAQNGGHGMVFDFNGEKWIVIHSPNELGKERVHFLKWRH